MNTHAIRNRNPLTLVTALGAEFRDGICIVRKHGFKELVHRKGKRAILAVIGYYLVRDSILYLLIPYCIAKGIF
jgi:hypothetical protein